MKRVCTKCGIEKPATLDFFHKGDGRFGLKSECKLCRYRRNHTREGRNDSYDLFIQNGFLSKTCRCCKNIIPLRCFNRQTTKGLFGRASKCKACAKNNRDYAREYKKYYTDKNIKKDPQYKKTYIRNSYLKYENNPEFRKIQNQRSKECSNKATKELNDAYVKRQLKRRGIPDPTSDVIETKRELLKLKRKIKQYEKEQRNTPNIN